MRSTARLLDLRGDQSAPWSDRSPYKNDGTITNGTWIQLPSGVWVLSHNGTSSYVEFADATHYTFINRAGGDTPFSVLAWAMADDLASGRTLISKFGTASDIAEWIVLCNISLIMVNCFKSDLSAYIGRSAPFAAADYENKPVHIAATYSGNKANTGFKIYLDGVQADSANSSTGTYTGMIDTAAPVRVGARRYSDSIQLPWSGYIGELALLGREITSLEVREHYEASRRQYV